MIIDHLGSIASLIIDPHQFGFIKGRTIDDCIVGTSDCVNTLHLPCLKVLLEDTS